MKKIVFLSLVLITALSCSPVKISSDFDRTASFALYKTFDFTPEALYFPLEDSERKLLFNIIENEMAAKGLTKSNRPDVLIDLNIKTGKHTATRAAGPVNPNSAYSYGYGYGYGYGYQYSWGTGFSSTTINVDSYTDGTLFIDMIDARKKQLVWQGRGTKTLDRNADEKQRETNLTYAVKLIFTQYPPKK